MLANADLGDFSDEGKDDEDRYLDDIINRQH